MMWSVMEMPNLHPHPLAFPDNVIADSTFVLHHISVRHLSSHPFDISLSHAHKKYLAILASPHKSVIRQVSCLVILPGMNSTHRHLLSVVTSPLSYASEDIDTAHHEYTCGNVVDMREYTERDGGTLPQAISCWHVLPARLLIYSTTTTRLYAVPVLPVSHCGSGRTVIAREIGRAVCDCHSNNSE